MPGLNEAQDRAAAFGTHGAGGADRAQALLIIAAAGTGKTATLAHRVARLVLAGTDPARILLLTFTRHAAAGSPAVRLPWSGTFHSIANRLLREYAGTVGLAPDFSVLDCGDSADLIDLLRHERGLFRAHVERKRENAAPDYDDLLLYWHALKPGGAGTTVVGDDAQAIYSFRAASVENILDFPSRCTPPAVIIALQRNYRSRQPVLDAANALIAGGCRQYPKTLSAARGGGARGPAPRRRRLPRPVDRAFSQRAGMGRGLRAECHRRQFPVRVHDRQPGGNG